jgi:Ca2+-binding RTX toxin-like protein
MNDLISPSLFSVRLPRFDEFDASILSRSSAHQDVLSVTDTGIFFSVDGSMALNDDAYGIKSETVDVYSVGEQTRMQDLPGIEVRGKTTDSSGVASDTNAVSYTTAMNDDVIVTLTDAVSSYGAGEASNTQNQLPIGLDQVAATYSAITGDFNNDGNSINFPTKIEFSGTPVEPVYADSAGIANRMQDQSSSDDEGMVSGCGISATKPDAEISPYSVANYYDDNGRLIETTYSDDYGNTSRTQYLYNVDADGIVRDYTVMVTFADAYGNSYSSKDFFDANGTVIGSSYSDSTGRTCRTQYETIADGDGIVTGNSMITTNTDPDGTSYTVANYFDLNQTLVEAIYSDSAGNTNRTQYNYDFSIDGILTGLTFVTINTDANGKYYGYTNHYDASWNLLESFYADSAGNSNHTQYLYKSDDDGIDSASNVITTTTDANGNSATYSHHYDADSNLTETFYSDSAGNNSHTQYQYRLGEDRIITRSSLITTTSNANGTVTELACYDLDGNTVISGGAGADTLYCGLDNEVLLASEGVDVFVFNAAPIPDGNINTISGFSSASDDIWLSQSAFDGLSSSLFGTLGAEAFWNEATSHDATDRILYSESTGALFYDADGTGVATPIQIAQLTAGTPLTVADVFII